MPTGSMAPTLLGLHHALTCRNCRFLYVVGADDGIRSGIAGLPQLRPARAAMTTPALACGGDRVIWCRSSSTTFVVPGGGRSRSSTFPGEPSQAYVKRVVGSAGRNDRDQRRRRLRRRPDRAQVARRARAMQILVHDSRFEPPSGERSPRWVFQMATGRRDADDWLEARRDRFVHRRRTSGVQSAATTGSFTSTGNRRTVAGGRSRIFTATTVAICGPTTMCATWRSRHASPPAIAVESIVVSLSVGRRSVRRDDSGDESGHHRAPSQRPARSDRPFPQSLRGQPDVAQDGRACQAAVCDRRVQVAVDGELLFDPFDYDGLDS